MEEIILCTFEWKKMKDGKYIPFLIEFKGNMKELKEIINMYDGEDNSI
jgi:hypothetical protein